MTKKNKKDLEILWKKKYWQKLLNRLTPSKRIFIKKYLKFDEFVIYFKYKPKLDEYEVIIRPEVSEASGIVKRLNDHAKNAKELEKISTQLAESNSTSKRAKAAWEALIKERNEIVDDSNKCLKEFKKAEKFMAKYLDDNNVYPIERVLVEEDLWPKDLEIEGKDPYEFFGNIHKNKKSGFVYFIKNDDIYKIGITDNLMRRMKELQADEMINTVKCVNYESLEKELHQEFKKYRIPQTEYFRLTPDLVEQVNKKMIEGANF